MDSCCPVKSPEDPKKGTLREVRIKPAQGGFLVHAEKHGEYGDSMPSVHKTLDEAHAQVKEHFKQHIKRSTKR